MSEKPLHVRVAEALGWTCIGQDQWNTLPRYDADWSAAGPLIEKYKIELSRWNHATGDRAWWRAEVWGLVRNEHYDEMQWGRIEETKGYEHPLEAICHLILALHAADNPREGCEAALRRLRSDEWLERAAEEIRLVSKSANIANILRKHRDAATSEGGNP